MCVSGKGAPPPPPTDDDSGGPPPPPPPPPIKGGAPPPPPSEDGAPPPPPPPPMKGKPASSGDNSEGAPPPPPPPGAPPGPPPPPGFGPPPALPAKKATAKQAPKPSVKMRLLQWTKIPAKKVRETVWGTLEDEDIKFDYKEIESMFAAKVIEKGKGEGGASEDGSKEDKDAKKKPGSVTIIEAKRAQNIAIALAQFKCTFEELRDGIINMRPDILTVEGTQALYVSAPIEEEVIDVWVYLTCLRWRTLRST